MRVTEQVLRAMRWDTLGTLVTSGITFLTTVWLARLLGPDRFGVLAALLALLGLAQLLASGGIRQALLRFVPEAMQAGGTRAIASLIVKAAVGRTAILVAASLPLLLLPQTVAAVGLGRPDLAGYVRLLPLLLALPLYADVLAASLIALFRQPVVRAAGVANKVVFALCLLSIPAWRDPLHGVFAAWVAGWSCEISWLAAESVRLGVVARASWRAPAPIDRLLSFSGAAYALSLIGFVLGRQLDILLLTRLGEPAEAVARYAVAFSFVTTVLALPLLPIAGGFDVPLIARLYGQRDWNGLRQLFHAFFEYVYIFMLPLIGGGLVLGPSLVRVIYGSAYASVSTVLFALLILLGLTKLGGITGPFLLATDRERTLLKIRLTMALVNIGAALALIPRLGPVGAAMATGVAMLGMVLWEGIVVQRFLRPRYPWGFLARTALATVVMMGAVRAGQLAIRPDPGILLVLALVALGGVVYAGMLLWLRPVSAQQSQILASGRVPTFALLVRWIERPPTVGATEPLGHGRA